MIEAMFTITTVYALSGVFLVSLASLLGVLTLAWSEARLYRVIFVLVALSVGALFGDVFLHLIPEIFEAAESPTSLALSIMAGILVFFVLEKFLRWSHHHPVDVDEEKTHIHPVGYLNLVADGLHNFIDGVIIGISFLASPAVGIATTIAVLFHELPQELGDFAILIHAGFSKRKALLFNFLSALMSVLGAILALVIGQSLEEVTPLALAFAAGGFIYIAGSDLVPELHKMTSPRHSIVQFAAIIVGVLCMVGLLFLE